MMIDLDGYAKQIKIRGKRHSGFLVAAKAAANELDCRCTDM
jgi:hypothetical protein